MAAEAGQLLVADAGPARDTLEERTAPLGAAETLLKVATEVAVAAPTAQAPEVVVLPVGYATTGAVEEVT